MKKMKITAALAVSVALLLGAPAAQAERGIAGFDVQTQAGPAGGHYAQAGGHPYAIKTSIEWNNQPDPNFLGARRVEGSFKDVLVDTPPGVVGNVAGLPICIAAELASHNSEKCPVDSQIGRTEIFTEATDLAGGGPTSLPLFNMEAPAGLPARFGFNFSGVLVFFDVTVRSDGDYGLTVGPRNAPQALRIFKSTVSFWGVPSDPRHDSERGPFGGLKSQSQPKAFITNSTSCTAPGEGKPWTFRTNFWEDPATYFTSSIRSHEEPGFPEAPANWGPQRGVEGCDIVPFEPTLTVRPTTKQAESPTGLDVQLKLPEDGFNNPAGIAQSNLKDAILKLPEGMTINPSAAEGLGFCKPADFARETATSEFGAGCPADSKLGTVHLETPAISDSIEGNVFIAQQDDPKTTAKGAENPFDSLIALYIVMKNQERGLIVKLLGKVEPDEKTGQLITSFPDSPQLPFSELDFKFREGQRSPLVSPPACGAYEAVGQFSPWSDPARQVTRTSEFQITTGPGGGPCPPAGVPPFHPGFEAGSINNNAKSYTPFDMRLTRRDGEQDMTRFSSILPPGVVGKLAGVGKCSDAAAAAAKAKSGREELASPSCPASSQVGRTLAGAGVGSVLVYVPGKVYLGGPYKGDPLSVIAITPAVAGPFDGGTVVVREALDFNPDTAEVEVDGTASDPIPHILNGIPLKLRDLRVYVDRDNFIINPTSCDPSSAKATLFGSYLDILSPADDRPVDLASRFQAANCSSLPFKPKLSLRLNGGTRRGGHPALKAVLNARPGDANIGKAVVTLPRASFLDQAHIRTICTRVQFAAKACPPGAQYGYATAYTPLLDEPLQGPVYLRSSNHKLPDLVAALHGLVDVNVLGRIDSYKGGIRSSFETVPDAPVSKFVLSMQGGKKGLVINSRNLCAAKNRADALFTGQNGKPDHFHPLVKARCGKAKKGKKG